MKKMIPVVAAMLMSAATFAQASTTKESPAPATGKMTATPEKKAVDPAQRAKRETDQINGMVALGDKYDKVLAVNTTYNTKLAELRAGVSKDATDAQKTEMQTKRRELNQQHKKDLETAMGKDLFDKYEAAMKAKREEMRAKRQAGGAAPATNTPAPAEKK